MRRIFFSSSVRNVKRGGKHETDKKGAAAERELQEKQKKSERIHERYGEVKERLSVSGKKGSKNRLPFPGL
jgi:hypothetical protein